MYDIHRDRPALARAGARRRLGGRVRDTGPGDPVDLFSTRRLAPRDGSTASGDGNGKSNQPFEDFVPWLMMA